MSRRKKVVVVVGDQLSGRSAVVADGPCEHPVPPDLDQADPVVGKCAGGAAQHVDLEPFDVDLHTHHPPVPHQRVKSDQLDHHRPVRARLFPVSSPEVNRAVPQ